MWKVLLGLAAVAALAVALLLWSRGDRRPHPPTPDARDASSLERGNGPHRPPPRRSGLPRRRPAREAWHVEIPGGSGPIGVPGCDAYVRLFVCYLQAAPPARRRSAYDAFHTAVVALRLGVKESTSAKQRRRFEENCAQLHRTFLKTVAHYDYARHCLKRP